MIEINVSRFKSPPPFKHQLEGVRALVKHKAFFLADKPRTCKSRQVVDAACILADAGELDMVLVISPVAGRIVWGDPELGQVKKYSWLPVQVYEFREEMRMKWFSTPGNGMPPGPILPWIITNYEFIRSTKRTDELIEIIRSTKNIMLVLDESSAVGNHKSQQSKAVAEIRKFCTRCVMLNGTPGAPEKIWSQFNILDHVLDRRYKSFMTYKWTFGEYGPKTIRPTRKNKRGHGGGLKVVSPFIGWKKLDYLSRITAPWCLRRERKDCPELTQLPVIYKYAEVALTKETWHNYQKLKREAILQLSSGEVYVSPNAGVSLLRLAQICSGHLGGFTEGEAVRDLSQEKMEYLAEYVGDKEKCDAQNFIVWCRWKREREMFAGMLKDRGLTVYQIYGNQPKAERRIAEMILAEGTERAGLRRIAMLAQPGAGGTALDMSAATEVFRLSSDYNPQSFEQSNDRPLGPAQKAKEVLYTSIIATGPSGQRTIEHTIAAAQEEKKNLERMTCAEWKKELERE